MELTFSIQGALKEAWALFRKHAWFFLLAALVNFVISFISNGRRVPLAVAIVATLASFIWTVVWMKVALAAADGKEDKLTFSAIKEMLPSWQQAVGLIGLAIVVALAVLCGFILLIIPGFYIAFRLSLSNFVFIDQNLGIKGSIKHSWHMTKGKVFWTAVLVILTAALLYIVGLIAFGVGILVTYPLGMILMAKFYRALSRHYEAHAGVIVQPVEIRAETPPLSREVQSEEGK